MGGGVLMDFGGNKVVMVLFFFFFYLSLTNVGFGWLVVGCACLW